MLKLCSVLTVNKVTVVLRKRVYVQVVFNYAVLAVNKVSVVLRIGTCLVL